MLGLIKHQDYLRIVDIKESDFFVERLYQKVCQIFSLFDIRDDDESDFFKTTKSLSNI